MTRKRPATTVKNVATQEKPPVILLLGVNLKVIVKVNC